MKNIEITKQIKEGPHAGKSATVLASVPETLDEAKQVWGDEVAYSMMIADYRVSAQAVLKSLLSKGTADADLQNQFNGWKPGVKRAATAASPESMLDRFLATASDEEKQAFFAKLREKAGM